MLPRYTSKEIQKILRETRFDVTEAARQMGIHKSSLYHRLHRDLYLRPWWLKKQKELRDARVLAKANRKRDMETERRKRKGRPRIEQRQHDLAELHRWWKEGHRSIKALSELSGIKMQRTWRLLHHASWYCNYRLAQKAKAFKKKQKRELKRLNLCVQ